MGGIHSGHYVTYRFVKKLHKYDPVFPKSDEAHWEAKVVTDGSTLLTQL